MSISARPLLIRILVTPASARHAAIGVLSLTLVGAAYCAGLNALQFGAIPWLLAVLWAAATVAPWYLAYEANKQVLLASLSDLQKAVAFVGVLVLALLFCGGCDWALGQQFGYGVGSAASVHVYHHLPETLAVAMLTAAASALRVAGNEKTNGAANVQLPIAPELIHLVRSAGNYVELETEHRVLLVRRTMSDLEAALRPHGLIRISRSRIIPRRRIERVRNHGGRTVVQLTDGSQQRVGSSYAAQLRLALPDNTRRDRWEAGQGSESTQQIAGAARS